jgi:uncharacterized protein YebE (UPF0316 family)
MSALGTALLIFLLRIGDVSIGTVRVLYTVRGKRGISMLLGFVESLVWIFAISTLVAKVRESPWQMFAWAIGFSAGTALGITLEQWIASGSILIRIISVYHSDELRGQLREMGFGVTSVNGEGRDGSILILFVVAPRRRGKQVVSTIEQIDPEAFVTVEPVSHAIGGYLPESVSPTSLKK